MHCLSECQALMSNFHMKLCESYSSKMMSISGNLSDMTSGHLFKLKNHCEKEKLLGLPLASFNLSVLVKRFL